MNIIQKLTIRHMKMNRKRTLVTILGVIISAAMICAVSIMGFSYQNMMIQKEYATYGYWHVQYINAQYNETSVLKNDSYTDTVYFTKDLGFSLLEEPVSDEKPYLNILAYDETAIQNMSITMISGRLPESENEIIIPSHLANASGYPYDIGDIFTAEMGTRYHGGLKTYTDEEEKSAYENVQLDNSYGYMKESADEYGESLLLSGDEQTYTIVGICDSISGEYTNYSAGYTCITYLNTTVLAEDDLVTASVILNNINRSYFSHSESLSSQMGGSQITVRYNSSIFTYTGQSYEPSFDITMIFMVGILIIIIMIGSISLIHNAFAISISERSRYLGMLASVGATRKQKRSSVLFEGLVVGVISVPLGILGAYAGLAVTFQFLNPLLHRIGGEEYNLELIVNPLILVITIVICALTILISAYIPSQRAARLTPLDAIRQTADIKINQKAVKTSRLTQKVFGFEGSFALKNVKRNKKRYRSTLFSLIISLILFLTASSFCYYMRDGLSLTQSDSSYDMALAYLEEDYYTEYLEKLKTLEGTEVQGFYSYLDSFGFQNSLEESLLTEELLTMREEVGLLTDSFEQYQIYVLSDDSMAEYCTSINIDPDALDQGDIPGAILANQWKVADSMNWSEVTPIKSGTKYLPIEYEYFNENTNEEDRKEIARIEVIKETNILPEYLSYPRYISASHIVFISEQGAKDIIGAASADSSITLPQPYYTIILNNDKPETLRDMVADCLGEDAMNYLTSSYHIIDSYESIQSSDVIVDIFSILTYGFIGLITLICTANILNTISTSVALRKREFAIVKSTGMTPGSFQKMIYYESILYGVKALLYGMPISLGIMVLLYTVMYRSFQMGFSLPILNIVIAVLSIFFIVGISMLYSFHKIKSESIVDTLKDENV